MLKPGVLFHTSLILLILSATPLHSQEVVINEFLASNSSENADPDFNQNSDWFELYNPNNDTVDMSGYCLTDDLAYPGKWQFPQGVSLAPGEFMIVWADGEDILLSEYHTNFKLSQGGEEIGLFDTSEVLIDSIVFGIQPEDISYGRQPDGGSDWNFFETPTPEGANSTPVFLKAATPRFSLPSGFYNEAQILEIFSDDTLTTIRYTLNGDEPTLSSPAYSEPLQIKSRIGDPNVFSQIRTTRDPYLWLPDWIPPEGEVFKANVIRARVFKNGFQPSEIISGTYFVDGDMAQRYPTLPVISITSDYKHLFDENTGIYVPGVNHRSGSSGSGNYFEDWEKPAHIEYFEPGGEIGFSQDVGMRIQGGSSPASPQKGLHIIARSEYGMNRIKYPVFKNDPSKAKDIKEFKRFIIRAWGSLIAGSLLNDAYAHRLMAKSDLDIQAYQPVIVFINGEYWGLHALREANKNSWYYQYHYGIDRDDPGCDILIHNSNNGQPYASIDEGNALHWNFMINYLETHDMSLPENYNYIKTQMDIDNFIAYMGHCIYVGKWDWPNNNDASWRPRTSDGRWRWIQFDMETGFGVATLLGPGFEMLGPQLNMFQAAIEGLYIPGFEKYGPHPVLAKLFQNEEFKEAFFGWFIDHSNHEFNPDTMNYILDEMAAEIRPYIEEYRHRWPFIGSMRGDWEYSLSQIKDFNIRRPDYIMQQMQVLNDIEENRAVDYSLLQIYPNPFVGFTTIRYQIPKAANVVIKIYNIHGQLITLYPKWHDYEGHYSISWDAPCSIVMNIGTQGRPCYRQ